MGNLSPPPQLKECRLPPTVTCIHWTADRLQDLKVVVTQLFRPSNSGIGFPFASIEMGRPEKS